MVVTVGKSWASMHDGEPPPAIRCHRDHCPASADYIGPIYFNASVIPDLDQQDVSVDGGVTC